MSKSGSRMSPWPGTAVVLTALAAVVSGAPQASAQSCLGDCNGNAAVEINELVVGINVAIGEQGQEACPGLDGGDGQVTIDNLLTAVGNGLGGCPSCNLAETSTITLYTEALTADLELRGQVDIRCGEGSERDCNCELVELAPVLVTGVGFVCIARPEGSCPAGTYACDGGAPAGVDLLSDHNIGDCDGNDGCNTLCEDYCAQTEGQPTTSNRGCEGFCDEGGSECDNDLTCVALGEGSCNGPDDVPFGNICECQCLNRAAGESAPAGTLSCSLPADLTVEQTAPCDGTDILIDVGSSCIPLTTAAVDSLVTNANAGAGVKLVTGKCEGGLFDGFTCATDDSCLFPDGTCVPTTPVGFPLQCSAFDAGSVSGLGLRGAVVFFGSRIGDILTGLSADCL